MLQLHSGMACVTKRIVMCCRRASSSLQHAVLPDKLLEVPGPRQYPVVGTLLDMITDKDFHKEKSHQYYIKLFQKYGPIVKVKYPGQPTLVMLSQPEDVKKILHLTMDNPVRVPMESLKAVRYKNPYYDKKAGIVSENGEEWHRVASKVRVPSLRLSSVRRYLGEVDQVALDFVQRISTLRDNSGEITVDFKEELEKWSLESISLIAMNQRLGCLDSSLMPGSEPHIIVQAARDFMNAIKECESGSKLWKLYATKAFKQLEHSMEKLKETCEGVLDDIETKMHAKLERDDTSELNIVEQLLRQPDLTRKDIITFMVDLIPGGTESTTDMAAVIFYLLAKNPHIQEKAQKELDQVLGDGSGPLTPHHLDQLSYIKAVVKESNRLLPPALGPVRILQDDVNLRGYSLRKGWLVFLMTAISGWNEAEFEHHLEFLPERWQHHRPYGDIHPCASIPFSFGPRMCVGRRIAEQEIYTLVARTLHRYTLEWKHGELERPLKFVFSPKGPLKLTFIDRQVDNTTH